MAASRQPLSMSKAAREGSMVTVILQPQKTTYKVHKAVLVEHSEYFKKALTGSWKEAQEHTVELEDVGDHVFNAFVDWLYGQPVGRTLTKNVLPALDSQSSQPVALEAYVFGDRFMASRFKEEVLGFTVAALQVRDALTFGFPHIAYVFANLPQDDIMLQLIADVHCNRYKHSGYRDDREKNKAFEELPPGFLVRIAMGYGDKGGGAWKLDESKYQLERKAK